MKLIFTWTIFLIVIMLNITALYFMIKKFFQIDKISGKKSSWRTVTGVFSIIINLVIVFGVCYAMGLGLLLISAYGLFCKRETIYISDFSTGLILIESAIFLPYGLNLLLYKLWYKKTGFSKRLIFPSIVIGIGNFILCVFWMIVGGYINDWATWPWKW